MTEDEIYDNLKDSITSYFDKVKSFTELMDEIIEIGQTDDIAALNGVYLCLHKGKAKNIEEISYVNMINYIKEKNNDVYEKIRQNITKAGSGEISLRWSIKDKKE
ncbi:MAG: hypothetical protein H7836_12430 [Magnetococcus sp. YQC-3]